LSSLHVLLSARAWLHSTPSELNCFLIFAQW
jgi:hypothetical protein